MNDVPLRSHVYSALCELCDASDNLHSILSRLDDECAKSLVLDICNDVENAINKLNTFSL